MFLFTQQYDPPVFLSPTVEFTLSSSTWFCPLRFCHNHEEMPCYHLREVKFIFPAGTFPSLGLLLYKRLSRHEGTDQEPHSHSPGLPRTASLCILGWSQPTRRHTPGSGGHHLNPCSSHKLLPAYLLPAVHSFFFCPIWAKPCCKKCNISHNTFFLGHPGLL